MKVNIQNLKDGNYAFAFKKRSEELELEDVKVFAYDIQISSQLDKHGSNICAFSHVATRVNYMCDRCLKSFSDDIDENFTVLFTTDRSYVSESGEDLVQFISPKTREIDLSFGVRESLLLALPMKVLCSEGCKGLCPHCGANLNEESCDCLDEISDPRWAELRKLLS